MRPIVLLIALAAAACGGRELTLFGSWSGGFYDVDGTPLSCAGHDFTGKFTLVQQPASTISGDWQLCDGGLHGTLTGSVHPDGAFDFALDGAGVAVVGRLGADDSLNGEAVGLSTVNARFHAHRAP